MTLGLGEAHGQARPLSRWPPAGPVRPTAGGRVQPHRRHLLRRRILPCLPDLPLPLPRQTKPEPSCVRPWSPVHRQTGRQRPPPPFVRQTGCGRPPPPGSASASRALIPGTGERAVLEDATTVVIKRLKEVNAVRRDFEQQMELVGRILHDNFVELRAYYYSKDEKLLVYDYYGRGSVYNMLHDFRFLIAVGSLCTMSSRPLVKLERFLNGWSRKKWPSELSSQLLIQFVTLAAGIWPKLHNCTEAPLHGREHAFQPFDGLWS